MISGVCGDGVPRPGPLAQTAEHPDHIRADAGSTPVGTIHA